MTTDDLSTPLGQETQPRRRRRLPFSGIQAIAAVLGLFLLAFAGVTLFHQDRLGGEPVVRVALQPDATTKPADKDAAAPAAGDHAKPNPPAAKATLNPPANGQKTITIIDGSSGARQDVVVASEGSADDATSAIGSGIDPRLLEKSRYGMIPVAAGGTTPFTAYAAGHLDVARANDKWDPPSMFRDIQSSVKDAIATHIEWFGASGHAAGAVAAGVAR